MSAFPPPLPPPSPGTAVTWSAGGGPLDDPLVSSDVGSWVAKSIALVRRAWRPMLVVHLLAAVPTFVATLPVAAWLADVQDRIDRDVELGTGDATRVLAATAALLAVSFLVSSWGTLCAYWIGTRVAHDEEAALGPAVRFGLRRLGAYVAWWLLAGVLVLVGLVLFVVPGVWLLVVVYAALPGVIAFERGRYGGALSRAVGLVRGRWWVTFGRLLLLVLAVGAWSALTGAVGGAVAGDSVVATQLVASLAGAASGVVTTAFGLVLYAELRAGEHPVTTAWLAGELD
jgi:hypothetical protein